jgi:hypothetical protein
MQLEARGLIYRAADRPAAERIAFFTSLCPLESGAMLSGFYIGSGKHSVDGSIRLCRSRDGGATWQELPARFATSIAGTSGSLAGPEMVEAEPGRLLLFATWFDRSDPARPLFDPTTEGILRSKQLMAVSRDDGDSWSDWQVLPTPGLTGCATTGPVVRWSDGAIAYAFESFKEYDDPRPAEHGAWLLVSRDGGRTFSEPVLVARHPEHKIYYWDQRLCATRVGGEFVAMFWTHDRAERRDISVHLRRAVVRDRVVVGEPIVATSIPGQIAAPLVLDDGRILAFVVDRGRPGTMKLWVSTDGGATWPEPDCLVVHTHDERALLTQGKENIDFAQYWEDMGKWSFGHPAIRHLGDGRVLLAFYAGTPDAMSVHWARVRFDQD